MALLKNNDFELDLRFLFLFFVNILTDRSYLLLFADLLTDRSSSEGTSNVLGFKYYGHETVVTILASKNAREYRAFLMAITCTDCV